MNGTPQADGANDAASPPANVKGRTFSREELVQLRDEINGAIESIDQTPPESAGALPPGEPAPEPEPQVEEQPRGRVR